MAIKLKGIKDPGLKDKGGKQSSIPISPPIDSTMKMRKLEIKQFKNNKVEDITILAPSVTDETKLIDKIKKFRKLEAVIQSDCHLICLKALEAIESVDSHKFFTIGKGANRIFCGQVIHRVSMGSFASIGGGQCVIHSSQPLNKDNTFKFEKNKQLVVKAGSKPGTDYFIVVSANGCVLFDAGASAAFNMPVFVVEQTGEYYKLEKGQRVFYLKPGNHILIYTYQAPILITKGFQEEPQSKVYLKDDPSSPSSTQLIVGQVSIHYDWMKEEPKKVEPKKEEPKKVEPKKEEPKKVEPKKEEPKKVDSLEATPPPPPPVETKSLILIEDSKEDSSKEKEEPMKEQPLKNDTKAPEPLKTDSNDVLNSSDSKEDENKKEQNNEESLSVSESKPVDLVKPATEEPKTEEPVEAVENLSNPEGLPKAKIISIVVAIVLGLLLLHLFFGGSKGEDDNKENKSKAK